MNPIENFMMSFSNADEATKQRLQLANYLYKDIKTEDNGQKLDDLVKILTDVGSPQASAPIVSKRVIDNSILRAFYEYLINSGLTDKTAYDYVMRARRTLSELNITLDNINAIRHCIDELIICYSKNGKYYEKNRASHNSILSSLKKLKEFTDSLPFDDIPLDDIPWAECNDEDEPEFYLSWAEGYHSFAVTSKHLSSYEIVDDEFTATFTQDRAVCDHMQKTINKKNMNDLIGVFKRYKSLLSDEPRTTPELFSFGGMNEYSYTFEGKQNYRIPFLFEHPSRRDLVEKANKELFQVIENIINQ